LNDQVNIKQSYATQIDAVFYDFMDSAMVRELTNVSTFLDCTMQYVSVHMTQAGMAAAPI
jgi:hypothetical protein